MPSPSRSALALAAALLSGCASRRAGSAAGEEPEGAALDVSSAGWMNGVFERSDSPRSSAAATAPNRAMRPDVPWMGTIGVKGLTLGEYEVGGGFFVPTLDQPRYQTAVPVDRMRAMGVGVWLKIDF